MPLRDEMEKQGEFLFKYRGVLPLIILLVGLAVYIFTLKQGGGLPDFVPIEFYDALCLCVCFLGFAIRIYTVGHTPHNTSGRNTAAQFADELNTTGIYSAVRHPLYLGNFFMWLGIAMVTQSLWFSIAFILLYWLYYERIMLAEERFLIGKFGNAYNEWAEKTPPFVPSFKQWRASKMWFSWKKVLKKEKNGLFAMFLTFFIFKGLGAYFTTGNFHVSGWLLYATLISGIIYFVLKVIKKRTSWLNEEGR